MDMEHFVITVPAVDISCLPARCAMRCAVFLVLTPALCWSAQEEGSQPWYHALATYAQGLLDTAQEESVRDESALRTLVSDMGSRLPEVSAQLMARFLSSPASSAVGSLRKQGRADVAEVLSDPRVREFTMDSLGLVRAELAEALQKNVLKATEQAGRAVRKYFQPGVELQD